MVVVMVAMLVPVLVLERSIAALQSLFGFLGGMGGAVVVLVVDTVLVSGVVAGGAGAGASSFSSSSSPCTHATIRLIR